MKLKPAMTREEIARKQKQAARGYDLADESEIGDDVMSMSPEEFLDFIGKADKVTIKNPVSRNVLRRKMLRLGRERRAITLCMIKIKTLIGD